MTHLPPSWLWFIFGWSNPEWSPTFFQLLKILHESGQVTRWHSSARLASLQLDCQNNLLPESHSAKPNQAKKKQLPWICSKGQGSLFSNRENFRQEGNLDLYDLNFYVDQLVWNDEPTSSHRDIQRIAAAWDTLTQPGPNKLSITETLGGKMQPYLGMQSKGQIKSVYPDAS